MIELNKETEEYAEKHGFRIPYDGSNKFYDDNDVKWSKEGFISEANSKFVKQQLLLAQIDILKKLSIDTVYFYNTKEGRFTKKLQEKLKQLQDE